MDKKFNIPEIVRIISGTLGLISIISILIILYNSNLSHNIIEILRLNMGSFEVDQLLPDMTYFLKFSALFILAIILFFIGFTKSVTFTRQNTFWFSLCIVLAFCFFLIGIYFINGFIGIKTIDYSLQDHDLTVTRPGTVKCMSEETLSNIIFVGQKANCDFYLKTNLSNLQNRVQLRLNNNSQLIINSTGNSLSFKAPSDLSSIYFVVYGNDSINNPEFFTVSYKYTFLEGIEEYKSHKERFLQYVLGLLAITFIAIPSLIVNIRELL